MAGGLSERDDPKSVLRALEAAADRLGLGVVIGRIDTSPPQMVHASTAAVAMFGRPAEELFAISPLTLVTPAEADRIAAMLAARTGIAPPLLFETVLLRPDGMLLPVEVGTARVTVGEQLWVVAYLRDVSVRRAAEDALRRSEARFRSLVDHAPDGVVIVRGRTIVFMNDRAARLLGLASPADGVGREITSLLPPEEAARAGQRLAEIARTGDVLGPSDYRVNVAGVDRIVEINSLPMEYEGAPAVLAFARDVTDRRTLHQELVRTDRLAAVGALAAAVAHEINNPLTYAQLGLQYVERELAAAGLPEARARALLEHVRNARHGTERVATIVRDLRTFARADDAPPGPVDLIAAVERAIKLAENEVRHRARLVRRWGDVPAVDGNASRLEQVVLNLLVNAIQALPHGDPSRDEIAVEIAVRGDVVDLVVADTGPGIPPGLRDRVFDPFFTTKPVGEGTGLGLSVCRSIVEGMGGTIAVDDHPGPGTRIRVTLAIHTPGRRAAKSATVPPPVVPSGPRLCVLVVDDEPLIRRVLTIALSAHHEVHSVDGGEAALAAIAAREHDVIVCDLMMPGLSGMDVYEAVRRDRPELARRFVFVTGGAFVPRLAEFLERTDNPMLLKPFDVAQVLGVVRAAAER